MPYSGYTSKEVCDKLRRTRQALHQAGIFKKLRVEYPFGGRNPLYNEADVMEWDMAIMRYDGLVALGRISPKSPLVNATNIEDRLDDECPKCEGYAVADNEATVEEYLALVAKGKFPRRVWCPKCGVVELGAGPKGSKNALHNF